MLFHRHLHHHKRLRRDISSPWLFLTLSNSREEEGLSRMMENCDHHNDDDDDDVDIDALLTWHRGIQAS